MKGGKREDAKFGPPKLSFGVPRYLRGFTVQGDHMVSWILK